MPTRRAAVSGMTKVGEYIFLVCPRFFYWGRLAGMSGESFWLTDAYIIYETGPWKDNEWQTIEKLPSDWFVSKATVESWGQGKLPSWVQLAASPAASADATVTGRKRGRATGSRKGGG